MKHLKDRIVKLRGHLDIDSKKIKLSGLEKELSEPSIWNEQEKAQALSKESNFLRNCIIGWESLDKRISDLAELYELAEAENDGPMLEELVAEQVKIEKSLDEMEFRRMLSGESDHLGAVLTINAGAGGTDAQDWASMLLRMYMRWIERKEFKHDIIDYQDGEEAGIKSATILIEGEYAYGYLKAENGIHRIVRISPFDSNARRHTSFAAVFASPQIDDSIAIDVSESDLKIDTFRAGGAGGQHVNTTDSAVRITHMPTGIVVQCQNERSQHKNKATAMKVLKSRLYEREMQLRREKAEEVNSTKKKIEWGSQIRSYVLHPYQMVKDHRTGYEVGNIDSVLDGGLEPFMVEYLMQTGGMANVAGKN
ncbi:MAG: peptide chain release factor 2 [Oligoflexia bacterium]|nr:peptide chain release factor 2 [Oligoflexia bacterium]